MTMLKIYVLLCYNSKTCIEYFAPFVFHKKHLTKLFPLLGMAPPVQDPSSAQTPRHKGAYKYLMCVIHIALLGLIRRATQDNVLIA